uniref:hypothetical protein n=1 Tax=Stenoxybacter acetivorans TaxID=422441 RepID=UPI00055CFC76
MNKINNAYINALLADAAYVENLAGGSLAGALKERMTEPVANFIANNFEVITQQETGDIVGSGFDATVWRGKLGTLYSGEVYISFQGSLGFADFADDDDLALKWAATEQITDMINWWKRITTPKGEMVQQFKLVPIAGEVIPILYQTDDAEGTGELVGVTSVHVNGHSLGGHLASVFVRFFGGMVNIEDVYTYNSAGFNIISELFFKQLDFLLQTGGSEFYEGQNNYFAENGISITTNDWWFNQIGIRQEIFNEESSILIYQNHSIYKLVDTLALGNLLGKLDKNLTLKTLNDLLSQASNETESSLEKALDQFRQLILNKTNDTLVGDDNEEAPSRVNYHENLAELEESKIFQALTKHDNLQIQATTAALAVQDNEIGIAHRYALAKLNAYALIGVDYSQHNNGELDLYDAKNNIGQMTQNWLTDRNTLLSIKNILNKYDFDYQKVFSLDYNGSYWGVGESGDLKDFPELRQFKGKNLKIIDKD